MAIGIRVTNPGLNLLFLLNVTEGTTYGEQTITNACNMTDSIYSPPAQKKQQDIFEQGGSYYRRKDDKYYRITNFTVIPGEMVISDDETQLSCEFVTDSGEKFPQTLLSSDFSTLAKLKGVLNKNTIALSFMGGEGDLELFKIYVYALKWQKMFLSRKKSSKYKRKSVAHKMSLRSSASPQEKKHKYTIRIRKQKRQSTKQSQEARSAGIIFFAGGFPAKNIIRFLTLRRFGDNH